MRKRQINVLALLAIMSIAAFATVGAQNHTNETENDTEMETTVRTPTTTSLDTDTTPKIGNGWAFDSDRQGSFARMVYTPLTESELDEIQDRDDDEQEVTLTSNGLLELSNGERFNLATQHQGNSWMNFTVQSTTGEEGYLYLRQRMEVRGDNNLTTWAGSLNLTEDRSYVVEIATMIDNGNMQFSTPLDTEGMSNTITLSDNESNLQRQNLSATPDEGLDFEQDTSLETDTDVNTETNGMESDLYTDADERDTEQDETENTTLWTRIKAFFGMDE